jgi:hypothetical protein
MPRSALNAPAVLRAITAAVAVVILAAGPASARPDPSAGPAARPAPATCQAADLGISVPAAIAGDPGEGMGKRAWNIVFRNTSKAACSLRVSIQGWVARCGFASRFSLPWRAATGSRLARE